MTGRPSIACSSTSFELPALDPSLVDDEEGLAHLLEAWAASDPCRAAQDIECFEAALRACLDPSRWRLASRLLGLLRAAADDRLVQAVRHAFAEGRRFPLPSEQEEGAS